ncbi:MAG TPA: FxsA family protein [Devosia sp.]|nr:FxsA family protein [Devosia sp.]
MARFFALGLLVLPIIEIALFIKVGQSIGLWPTLALIIGAALLGGLLLRQQGLQIVGQLRNNMSSGQLPGRTIAETMMIALAALLLVLPGFLSDIVALALLLPPVRGWIYAGLASRLTVVSASASYRSTRQAEKPRMGGPGTIDLDEDDYRPQ